MNSEDLLRAGKLSEARQQAIAEVKTAPGDISKRFLLFQILAFQGEWDKAEKHLDAIVAQDPVREPGVQVFKNLVTAERRRQELWKKGGVPDFIPETPVWLQAYLDARQALAQGQMAEVGERLAGIEEQLIPVSGEIQGKNFTGLQDTDDCLTFFVEAFVFERYVWIPFSQIRELAIDPPKNFSDLLWITARLTTWEGLTLNCQLPVLYPGSHQHPDDRVKLGRMTDWVALGNGLVRGAGQHVYAVGEDEVAILEVGEVILSR
jgi:type VI secretion system protein ImpE